MGKHTNTPWQQRDDYTNEGWITIIGNVDGEYIDGQAHCTYDVIARCEDEFGERLPNVSANAARIVACVNACEGLADPSVVPELVDALRMALEAIDDHNTRAAFRSVKIEEFHCMVKTGSKITCLSDARAALAKAKGEATLDTGPSYWFDPEGEQK